MTGMVCGVCYDQRGVCNDQHGVCYDRRGVCYDRRGVCCLGLQGLLSVWFSADRSYVATSFKAIFSIRGADGVKPGP